MPRYLAVLAMLTLCLAAVCADDGTFDPAQSWDELLEHCDADGDGEVSRGEFGGPGRAFECMDADGDGAITGGEAQAAVRALAVAVAFVEDGSRAVATVNGVAITQAALSTRMVTAVGRDILKDMIDRELIRQAAEQAGVVADGEEMQREIDKAKQGFPSEEAFQMFLATRGITLEDWIGEVRMALTARQLTLKDITYTEDDLKQFFQEHKDRYRVPLHVSVSEIVVATKEDADRIVAELRADPERFAELARAHSLSPYSKSRSGKRQEDMPVDRIQIERVRQAVTELPVGEISDPIRADMGGDEVPWYIVRVDERKQPREGSFEEDRERVERDYQSVHARSLAEIIKEHAETSEVVVLDPRFQELNEAYGPVPTHLP